MSKLVPIDTYTTNSTKDIMDRCHTVFKRTMASKEDRPQLDGREVLVPLKWLDYKAEVFWHCASIEQKNNINILPCNNDIASSLCDANCVEARDSIVLNGNEREKCIYRAARINWIREVLNMYNNKDKHVKYWEKVHTNKRNRIYLRYQEEENDYLVILEDISEKKVRLITAYPIFFLSAKKGYEKDYQNYSNSKKKK